MHYRIRDMVTFIRNYDSSGILTKQSNTVLRKYVRACLEKHSFYLVYHLGVLVGLVEWYRIKDCKYLVNQVRQRKFLNSNPNGHIIYIHNAVFRDRKLTLRVFRQFSKIHINIRNIIWFRYKTKKFKSISVKT